jgi:hypothetical protein
MIISDLRKHKDKKYLSKKFLNKIIVNQKVKIVCDICKNKFTLVYRNVLDARKKYNKDLCFGCKQKEQYKRGERKFNGHLSYAFQSGTLEEKYGKKKAKAIRDKLSKATEGKNNPMYGRTDQVHGLIRAAKERTGKTNEQTYGKVKAALMRKKISKSMSGEGNPMYGRPAPRGSGVGWKGWYGNFFFRSLLELRFLLCFAKKEIKSAEKQKYKILYYDYNGDKRNYFPDFIIKKELIEIKHSNGLLFDNTRRKIVAAKKYCKKHGLKFKIFTEKTLPRLTVKQVKNLIDKKIVKFQKCYKIKFKELSKKHVNNHRGQRFLR